MVLMNIILWLFVNQSCVFVSPSWNELSIQKYYNKYICSSGFYYFDGNNYYFFSESQDGSSRRHWWIMNFNQKLTENLQKLLTSRQNLNSSSLTSLVKNKHDNRFDSIEIDHEQSFDIMHTSSSPTKEASENMSANPNARSPIKNDEDQTKENWNTNKVSEVRWRIQIDLFFISYFLNIT